MPPEVEAAVAACKRMVAAWGGRHDWREYLGEAWVGASRAAGKGLRGKALATAAARGVIDSLRVDRPDPTVRRKGCLPIPPHVSGDAVRDGDGLTLFEGLSSPGEVVSPDRRLARLWDETRANRESLPPRTRIWFYLWIVEGWTQAEVGEAWGFTPKAVSGVLSRAARTLGRYNEYEEHANEVRAARTASTQRVTR